MPDSTLSSTEIMRKGVRRYTKSYSESQLSTTEIDEALNTVFLYKLPTQNTLNGLRTTLRFYTEPYVGSYSTNTADSSDPLYNFKNAYTVSNGSVFISGELAYFTQSRSDFYTKYPRSITSKSIGTGNGIEVTFTGSLDSYPVLPNDIIFASKDLSDNYLKIYDDGDGNLTGNGSGTIDYITGEYNIAFDTAPKDGEDIYVQSCTYKASRPDSVLFYDNTFNLRPIPDKSYSIEVDVLRRPTEMTNAADVPDIAEWASYATVAAARDILMYRGDFESAQILEVEMQKRADDILYKTVIENRVLDGYIL